MSWIDELKDLIPDHAKDIRLNLDGVLNRSSFEAVEVQGLALAAAFAAGNKRIIDIIVSEFGDEAERKAALTAASLMAMNNVWYPYVEMTEDEQLKGMPAQLRMNAYATHGGTTKLRFEAYALAASIVGKCHFCVKSHYSLLKKEGLSMDQLRDIGRIAATVNAAAKVAY